MLGDHMVSASLLWADAVPSGSLSRPAYDGMIDDVEKAKRLIEIDWASLVCPVLAVHSTIDKDVTIDHAERLERDVPGITIWN
jgi:hypothetical protein